VPHVIFIHEVAARDGLQNEAKRLATAEKLEFLRLLAASHPASLEVTSFVRPDAVPQLADAEEVCAALRTAPWRPGRTLVGLVMNERGYARFRAAGLDAITAVVGANEAFSTTNAGMSVARAVAVNRELCAAARADGVPVRMYLSMAFGSPREATPERAVLELVETFAAEGVARVMLSDTVGVGTPAQTRALVTSALAILPAERLGLHMHDTYGRALENCAAGYELGLRAFDASAGGTGGCPFAPGAAGNLATGALLAWAAARGESHGMDAGAVDEAARYLAGLLGRPLALGAQRGPVES
jgi:hydroxymethylglutaryl-CoA lyase